MLNLVVTDMAASLDFYRRLGVAVPGGQDTAGAHVELRMPGGFSLELDTTEWARPWHAGCRADPAAVSRVVSADLFRWEGSLVSGSEWSFPYPRLRTGLASGWAPPSAVLGLRLGEVGTAWAVPATAMPRVSRLPAGEG